MHHFSLFSARRPARAAAAALGLLLAVTGLAPASSYAQDPSYTPSSGSGQTSGSGDAYNPPVGVDTAGHSDAVATRNGRTTRRRPAAAPANPLVLTDPNRPSSGPGDTSDTSGDYPNAPGDYTNAPNGSPDSGASQNPSYGPGGYPPGTSPSNYPPNNYPPSNYPSGTPNSYPPGSGYSAPNGSANYSRSAPPYGTLPPAPGNRLLPPVVTREPGDYTVQANPFALAARPALRPLPLFGYDFFQPARQIILARRRALLPAPRPVQRYPSRYGTLSRSNARPSASANSSDSFNNYNNYNGYTYNGYNYGNPGGGYGTPDNTGLDAAALGYGASQRGGAQYAPGGPYAASSGAPGDYPPNDGSYPDSGQYSTGQYPNQQYPNSQPQDGQYQNGQSPSSQYQNNAGQNGRGDSYSANPPAGDPYSSSYSGDPDGAGIYGGDPYAGDGMNGSGLVGDVAAGPAGRRTPDQSGGYGDPNAPYSAESGPNGGFPGDSTRPLGGDIQLPGDEALLGGGSANAVTGQVADPVSTLYKNVLASLPPNYQLQPGDSLSIRYSALALAPREFSATVDLSGGITAEGIGRVSVAGRTTAQAEDALRLRLSRLYRSVDVSISLRQLRTIQVTLSGSAFAPGTYTVPATATAFNILNAAGGPTADGSLRDIRVLRGGRLVGTLDIYPLIGAISANPYARSHDIALQAGDTIYIPARLSRVSVRGEVRQPAVYELTGTETLRDALRYAGGVKPSGVDQNVHIDTVDNGRGRIIRDVSLSSKTQTAAVPIYDGDTVDVSSIRSIITNRVTIQGAVNQPGDFALTPGLSVSDLLARARGPLYNAYLDRADLIRLNADNTTTRVPVSIAKALDGDPAANIPLKRFDILRLYTLQDVAYLGRRLVTVRGAVQRPGLYTQSDNMKVSDLLLDSGGPLPDAYLNRAVLLHQRGDGTYAYSYISLREIEGGVASADLPVQDNDVLAVYKIGEAHFTPDHTVKVLGNVVAPGLYARGTDMRLSDLLKLAGAFKPGGGTRVTVAHARRPVTDKAVQVASSVPDQNVTYGADQTVTSGTDLALSDGDVVAVQGDGTLRDHPAVVTVTGMVLRPGPIFVQQGMRLSDAIKQAGGLRPEAFPQGAEFTRTSEALATTGQLDLAAVIARMSDMLNLSQLQREKAKSNLELIQAAGTAASGSSTGLIPGLGGAAANNSANPNLAPLTSTLSQNSLVSPARLLTSRQLQPNGAVAVQLASALKRPGSVEDVLLKDGDTLVVPETPTTVQVVGAVFNARGVLYRPGQSIDYYIQRSGDFTPDAARDRIEVIHAGGGLIPASKAGALEPGDLILVPTKVLAEKIGRSGNGFNDFFQGLVGSAIAFKVLGSVFGL